MTILQLIQAVCDELGLPRPNAAVTSLDSNIMQLLAMANIVGQSLISDFEWRRITRELFINIETSELTGTVTSSSPVISGLSSTAGLAATAWQVTGTGIAEDSSIQSIDSATQVTLNRNANQSGTFTFNFAKTRYELPADFNRPINQTQWDRSNQWELIGPKSAQEWQYLKGGIVSTGPRLRYRLLGNSLQLWPIALTTGIVAYEYVSSNWILGAGETEPNKASFSADDDTCIFRDRLMLNGIKLEYFAIKGFDTIKLDRDFTIERDKAFAQDKGAPILSLTPKENFYLLSTGNVPDGTIYGQR